MKHTRKCEHIRTSKRGRKFYAGRGIKRARNTSPTGRTVKRAKLTPDEIKDLTFTQVRDKDKPQLTKEQKDFARTMKILKGD